VNLRTFIAIDLPPAILRALSATQEEVQDYLRARNLDSALRLSPIKNLHLTLRFLGDTTPPQRRQVTTALQEIAAQCQPFRLDVDVSGRGLGGFPNLRQPRVLWSGVAGKVEILMRLQTQVEGVAQQVGFTGEEQKYSPHLTLARAAREADRRLLSQAGQAIGEFAQSATQSELMTFQVDHLTFYQSELSPGGSRYTVLALLPFASS
jgi:2'-5' RNA ligase